MELSWYNVTGTICDYLSDKTGTNLTKYKYDSGECVYLVADTIVSHETYWIQIKPGDAASIDGAILEQDEQGRVIARLENDIGAKDAVIDEKEAVIAEKDAVIDDKDAVIDEKEAVIDAKEAVIDEKEAVIDDKEEVIAAKDAVIDSQRATIAKQESEASALNNEIKQQKVDQEQALQHTVKSMILCATWVENHYTEKNNQLANFKRYAANTIQSDIDRVSGVESYINSISNYESGQAKTDCIAIRKALYQYIQYLKAMKNLVGSARTSYPEWIAKQMTDITTVKDLYEKISA